jgi:hypothetical protein
MGLKLRDAGTLQGTAGTAGGMAEPDSAQNRAQIKELGQIQPPSR